MPKKLTVIGAKGLLGSTLCCLASKEGYEVTGLGFEEMNMANLRSVSSWTPDADWVVNCAAVTDVDACETEKSDPSILVNAVAPEVIGATCAAAGVGFVHISTDYVFYGDGLGDGYDGWYDETDDPAPRNRYGTHKLMGEIGAAFNGAYVLRTAWLYGSGGKNFVSKAYELAARNQPVTADNVSSSSPTLASNLAKYILAVVAADERRSGAVYHCCDRGEATRWEMFDRVRRAMLPFTDGWEVSRGELYTGGSAKRPVRTPLDCRTFFIRFSSVTQADIKDAAVDFVNECRGIEKHVVAGEVVE